jgi:hypothetical protein
MLSSKTQLNNHPIYFVDTEFDSYIFYNDLSFEEEESTAIITADEETVRQATECVDPKNYVENEIWNMNFDGVVSKDGAGVDVWITPPPPPPPRGGHKDVFIQAHVRMYKHG